MFALLDSGLCFSGSIYRPKSYTSSSQKQHEHNLTNLLNGTQGSYQSVGVKDVAIAVSVERTV
jgi:hypothetical protein